MQSHAPSAEKILILINFFSNLVSQHKNRSCRYPPKNFYLGGCLVRRLNRRSKDAVTKNVHLIWLTVIDNKTKNPRLAGF
ncbi:MAG: hypothetical protein A3C71_01000 [Candidatus Yanofskybacteria bacterium RIFCSPHIGHO2_02_FULL_43_15c]|uniref:Uncharacterized protein n=1 Tax=Candidatus Yanofskybacteria bacterium RIFCSPHIGHO2_02_FULL_43_15c TaxID=1802679 RepID=A0A1F8FKJ9_9BACT|nr:MAG: hypothetical protein A3C71_01000 [Candidatus Yanofskybacteria bacterium RIFCSPHIGHO2_02_FULL_43_15c]